MAERKRDYSDASTGVEVVGAPKAGLNDLYYVVLQWSWASTIAAIGVVFLIINVAFAVAYALCDGVSGMEHASLSEAFFFSVQTFGTIGYGTMYPKSGVASGLMTLESFSSITLVALITGVVFAKFSLPRARIRFSKDAVVHAIDGVDTLSIRIANERKNHVVEATVRMVLIRYETTKEGSFMFRMYDLAMVRDRTPALTRSWVVMHRITKESPLFGVTSKDLTDTEAQIVVTVMGLDGTSSQTIHSQFVYDDIDVKFGMKFADLLIPLGEGRYRADYRRFDDTEKVA